MPSKSIITASLTPELTAYIASKVRSGHYRSASEVLRAALRLLIDADEQKKLRSAKSEAPRANGDR
jgi:antitoxin ParD1/3/4